MNLPMVEIKIEVLEEVLKTVDAKIETVDAEDSAALSVRLCHRSVLYSLLHFYSNFRFPIKQRWQAMWSC